MATGKHIATAVFGPPCSSHVAVLARSIYCLMARALEVRRAQESEILTHGGKERYYEGEGGYYRLHGGAGWTGSSVNSICGISRSIPTPAFRQMKMPTQLANNNSFTPTD